MSSFGEDRIQRNVNVAKLAICNIVTNGIKKGDEGVARIFLSLPKFVVILLVVVFYIYIYI